MTHDEIMDLAKVAADIRASDTAEFYAGRRVSERNYKEALRELSEAIAEQARRAACFDEMTAALEAYVSDTGLTDRERKDKALAALASAKGKT